jgi:rhodanese-related sulfurtransferase
MLRLLAETRLTEAGNITHRFLETCKDLEPIDRNRFLTKVREGAVTVLDVLPSEEFRAGHLPRIMSVSLKELERRPSESLRNREGEFYCREPCCMLSIEVAEVLRASYLDNLHAASLLLPYILIPCPRCSIDNVQP